MGRYQRNFVRRSTLPPLIAGSVPVAAPLLLAQTSTALPVLQTTIDEGVSVRSKHTSPGAGPFEDQSPVFRVRSCRAIPCAIMRGVLLTPLPPPSSRHRRPSRVGQSPQIQLPPPSRRSAPPWIGSCLCPPLSFPTFPGSSFIILRSSLGSRHHSVP